MKVRNLLFLILALLLLVSCTSKRDEYDSHTVSAFQNIYDIGEFFVDFSGRLFFGDFESLQTVPVCSKPNCPHSDESCGAYGIDVSNAVVYHDSYLYWFNKERIMEDGTSKNECSLYRCSLDGLERVKINKLQDGLSIDCVHTVISGDLLYFIASAHTNDIFDTERMPVYLYSYSFSQNKFTKLISVCDGYSTNADLRGIFDNKLYITYSVYDRMYSAGELTYDESMRFRHEIMINIETFEVTELLEIPLRISENVLLSASDDGVMVTESNGKSYTATKFTPQEWYGYEVVNGKVICFMLGEAYDYKKDVYYSVNTNGKNLTCYRNGIYVMSEIDDMGIKTYSTATEEELFQNK